MKEYIVRIENSAIDEDEEFVGFIRKQPEVIRCKDCKYWIPLLDSDHPNTEDCEIAYCTLHSIHFETPRKGYCYRAERRKDGID